MLCNICKISSPTLISEIEGFLLANDGVLTETNRKELVERFPQYRDEINKVTEQDCSMHWNFHQTAVRDVASIAAKYASKESEHVSNSITEDIGKDEAEVLYEMLNKQSATFNLLTSRINSALKEVESDEMNGLIVHPATLEMYKEMAGSIRLTVREIRDLNASINGAKNDAFEGLKALAQALTPQNKVEESDMTTDKFDY